SPAIAFAPLKPLSVRVYSEMTRFASLDELRSACLDLPGGHREIAASVAAREATLTKPPGSLGRLEAAVQWLALWQGKNPPRLGNVEVLVFAGNHRVTARGVPAPSAPGHRAPVPQLA